MSYFYPGYSEARRKFENASLDECLSLIDDLFGRDNIEDETDIEEVRAEAMRQLKEEWTDKSSPEFERTQFHVKIAREMAKVGY